MLRRVRERIQPNSGFTMIELMVVTGIIGILAAIGLPAFLDQQKSGHDASAKSDVRTVLTAVESCFTETKDYEKCDTLGELEATDTRPGVALTDEVAKAKGAAAITATSNTYTITAYSDSGNSFSITKAADGTQAGRSCTTGGQAGCKAGDVW